MLTFLHGTQSLTAIVEEEEKKMKGPKKENQYDDVLKDIDYHYKILGLDVGADKKDLIKTYKKALKEWSPAQYADDPGRWTEAVEMTQKIERAYRNILIYITSTQEPGPQGTGDKEQEAAVLSEKKEPTIRGISLQAMKPLTSIPNIAFLAYVCIVLALTIFKYEAFSVHLWFVVPPLIGCIAFNLVKGEARGMKYASIALTSIFMFLVFFLETDRSQKSPHKEEVKEIKEKVEVQTNPASFTYEDWLKNGDALKSAGKYKDAAEAYSKALEVNPGSSDAYYGRAIAYSLLKKDKEFISDLRDAARLGHIDAIKTLNEMGIKY